MRFTVTIEAPEGASALQGLANLPDGWRVVEYREVPQPNHLSDFLTRNGLNPPPPPSPFLTPPGFYDQPKDIDPGFIAPPKADPVPCKDDERWEDVLKLARRFYAPIKTVEGPHLYGTGTRDLIGTSPAVPPDTIVGLNPDGTIAGAEKVDTEAKA